MIALVGWLGSALCVWSLVQNDPRRFRALNLGACVVLAAFNVCSATWSAAILNVVVAAINIRQLLLLRAAGRTAITESFAAEAAFTEAAFTEAAFTEAAFSEAVAGLTTSDEVLAAA